MSNKRDKKAPFNAPSQVTEKYTESLNRAKSDETYKSSSESEGAIATTSGTEDPLDNVIPAPQENDKPWQLPKPIEKLIKVVVWIGAFLGGIGILIGIVLFFYNMNSSVQRANENIVSVETKVNKVESRVETLSGETKEQQNQVHIKLVELKGMIDRVLDNIIPARNNNQKSTQGYN